MCEFFFFFAYRSKSKFFFSHQHTEWLRRPCAPSLICALGYLVLFSMQAPLSGLEKYFSLQTGYSNLTDVGIQEKQIHLHGIPSSKSVGNSRNSFSPPLPQYTPFQKDGLTSRTQESAAWAGLPVISMPLSHLPAWVQILPLSLTSSIALGMSLNISRPQLHHLRSYEVKGQNARRAFSQGFAL